jgi:hypothetical protein
MADKESSGGRSGGIGFVGLLTIVFITLKLTGYIDWSWWWVLSPIWIVAALVGVVILFITFCYFMAYITGQTKWRN